MDHPESRKTPYTMSEMNHNRKRGKGDAHDGPERVYHKTASKTGRIDSSDSKTDGTFERNDTQDATRL